MFCRVLSDLYSLMMERHVTFVEPPEKGAATQWRLQKEHTIPVLSAKSQISFPVMRRPQTRDNLSAGNPVKVPVMPRPVTRGQSSSGSRICDDDGKGQQLQREATQLFERERSRSVILIGCRVDCLVGWLCVLNCAKHFNHVTLSNGSRIPNRVTVLTATVLAPDFLP